jgi:hypothetical protein
VDNGVGGALSATLAGDPFIKGRKLTRRGQAEKPWVSAVDSESWWEHRPGHRSIASGIATTLPRDPAMPLKSIPIAATIPSRNQRVQGHFGRAIEARVNDAGPNPAGGVAVHSGLPPSPSGQPSRHPRARQDRNGAWQADLAAVGVAG